MKSTASTAMAILLSTLVCYAQQPAATSTLSPEGKPAAASVSGIQAVTIPAGTKVLLALVRPVSTRTTKPGNLVYMQTTAPVMVGEELAIPNGTSVEGTLEKAPRANLRQHTADFQIRLSSLIFADGYTVKIPGNLEAASNLEDSTSTYGDAGLAPAVALGGGSLGGMAIGAAANGARGAATGGIIGGAIGAVAAIALAVHHGGVFMDVGTPVDMVLPTSLTLVHDRVLSAARLTAPPAPRPVPHFCYDAGSPGTPPTVIPGTPGTPGTAPTVIPGPPGSPPTVIPGTPATPGTPDTVIPGTPPTPPRNYPCPPF